MLETTESLLPQLSASSKPLSALCVGIDDVEEMLRLLSTLDLHPIQTFTVPPPRSIQPATYFGRGKVEEIQNLVTSPPLETASPDVVVVDLELSPNQLRNLEKAFGKPVLDRPGVIIEIFSRHARTKEAKTQVELARLQYLLPRLAHFWTHFERQRGGIGLKGMGEKQIEVDRRLVKQRMSTLRRRLEAIGRERHVQRAGRSEILKVALVGYTNAGKSTLLNQLTHSHVRAEDKLFATLDASVRALDPHSHPPIVLIDTVGFIMRLPPSLVASFRSTLEELHYADLLLHVVDGSSADAKQQIETTDQILNELGVNTKPRMTIINKTDLVTTPGQQNWARLVVPGAMRVSALNSKDILNIRAAILDYFKKRFQVWDVLIPYAESRIEALIRAHGSVERVKHLEKGTFFRIRMDENWAKKLELKRFKTGGP